MSAEAFTPWWRLLQGTTNTKKRLHDLHPSVDIATQCVHCNFHTEDNFHFVVGCPAKWLFWSHFLQELNLQEQFPSDLHIWSILVILTHYCTCRTLNNKLAALIKSAFASFWKRHYNCHFNQERWSHIAAMRLFHADHRLCLAAYTSSSNSGTTEAVNNFPNLNSFIVADNSQSLNQ